MTYSGSAGGNAIFSSDSATLTYEAKPISIKGAEYDVVDTKDGWYTLKDVLFFAEVAKGEKNAPEDVKGARMQQMVTSALGKYEKEKFAAPSHKGHHKAIGFGDPEFLGFMLPKRVGKTTLDGREQDCVFGDVKLKSSAFERVKNGELPYVSPEVDWETWQFSSLAFLDSMPPHFKGPLITVGKITEDAKAKFTVGKSISMGKFAAVDEEGKEKIEKKEGEEGDEHEDGKMCAHCSKRMEAMEAGYGAMDKTLADIHFKMGLPYKGGQMSATNTFVKPESSAPKEDNLKGNKVADEKKDEKVVTKFEDDPAMLAKFAAQEARTKALEDKLAEAQSKADRKARLDAAFAEMTGYPLTDAGKAGIEKFADEPEKLKIFIDVLKAQTPKNPPRTVAAFEAMGVKGEIKAVSGADPDIAAFQAQGPVAMEGALKYAGFFEVWKASKLSGGSSLRNNRKAFIETYMALDPSGGYVKNFNLEAVR